MVTAYGAAANNLLQDLNGDRAGADELITSALQPAFAKVVSEVRVLAKALDGIECLPELILTAGTERQSKAFVALQQRVAPVEALRSAWRTLRAMRSSEDTRRI